MDNIENDVLTIENGVVTKCKKDAVNVVIPEGITEIGKEAFYWCESLESVTFPESITTIGNLAFKYCKKLASVTFPESVTTIGNCAFEHCEKITSVVIPDGVKTLGNYAFAQCDSLKSAVIGKGVEKIGFEVFNDCPVLESVVIGENVKESDRYVLSQCESLSDVTFGGTLAQWENVKGRLHLLNNEGVKSIKCADGEWIKPVLYIENCCVLECLDKSAKSVTVPEGVTEIGFGAFEKCKALESVVISEGVTKLDSLAFCDCTALKSVVIPSTVTKIESSAFDGCEAVEKVVSHSPLFPVDEKKRKLYDATWERKKAILVLQAAKEEAKQEKIQQIQQISATTLFSQAIKEKGIEDFSVESVKSTKADTILLVRVNRNTVLLKVSANAQKWIGDVPKIVDILTDEKSSSLEILNALMNTKLPPIEIPKLLAKNITLKASKDKKIRFFSQGILRSVFDSNVWSLELVGLKEIEEKCFYTRRGCYPISSLVIGDGMEKIGDSIFKSSYQLTYVSIPESVTEIGKAAFYDSWLSEIKFRGTVAQWNAVKKGERWAKFIKAKVVKCTDGEVALDE